MGILPSVVNSEALASKLNAHAISTSKSESPASLAASTKSTLETVPNSGPMKIAARFSFFDSPSTYRASAQIICPGQGFIEVNEILFSL
jgi:hypothetical protein